ncbi:MAG: 3-hydroxyacyl-ACP dehydratase FabZ, partial [Candidatus Puniceispirillaceae bacterium]
LIDKIRDIKLGQSAVGIKAVSGNEPYFVGHFPGNPVMPGVLIVEAMAQTAGALAALTLGAEAEDKLVFLASVNNTKFKTPVRPGDLLEVHVEKIAGRGLLWKFSGAGMVDGKVVNQAEFSAMIVDKDS